MSEEIKFIESFEKLEVKEGDTIVLKTQCRLSLTAVSHLKDSIEMYKEKIGIKNLHLLVLEEGIDIGIISKNDS